MDRELVKKSVTSKNEVSKTKRVYKRKLKTIGSTASDLKLILKISRLSNTCSSDNI